MVLVCFFKGAAARAQQIWTSSICRRAAGFFPNIFRPPPSALCSPKSGACSPRLRSSRRLCRGPESLFPSPCRIAARSAGSRTRRRGYRYERVHPVTGKPWPPIPERLLAAWGALTGFPQAPQACLVNYYGGKARLGMHRDEDEKDFSAPILSVSLGDRAIFRIGGLKRRDPSLALELSVGRRARHGRAIAPPLSRHRPRLAGHLGPARRRRAHQPDAALCRRLIGRIAHRAPAP